MDALEIRITTLHSLHYTTLLLHGRNRRNPGFGIDALSRRQILVLSFGLCLCRIHSHSYVYVAFTVTPNTHSRATHIWQRTRALQNTSRFSQHRGRMRHTTPRGGVSYQVIKLSCFLLGFCAYEYTLYTTCTVHSTLHQREGSQQAAASS